MGALQTFYHSDHHYGLNLAFCGIEKCPNGHVFGPSKRTHYLFHYIVEGCGTYRVKDKTYPLKAGDGFIIFPEDVTLYAADHNTPWTYKWFAFDGPDAPGLVKESGLSSYKPIYTTDLNSHFDHLLNDMIQKALDDTTSYLSQISRLYELFSIMISAQPELVTPRTDYIKNAIKFIELNYPYDLKVSDIANAVNLERSYLYRKFIDELGLSPKDYLITHRLNMAKKMLQQREHSITEIAFSCGFKSSSAFHKHFKKHYNLTPKAYQSSY